MAKKLSRILPECASFVLDTQPNERVFIRYDDGDGFANLVELQRLQSMLNGLIDKIQTEKKSQTKLFREWEAEYLDNLLLPDNWFFPPNSNEFPYPCVYFLYSPKRNQVKIGYSTQLSQRVSAIGDKTGDRKNLYLIAVVTGDDLPRLEAGIHRLLKDARIEGEWFERNAAVSFVNTRANQAFEVPNWGPV